MNGDDSNKKGKLEENQEESDSVLYEDLTNDMLAQVVSVKASSSLTGGKVYVSHSMLTKDKSEQDIDHFGSQVKLDFCPQDSGSLTCSRSQKKTYFMVLKRTSLLTW